MALERPGKSQMEVNGVSPVGSYNSSGILFIVSLNYIVSFCSFSYIYLIVNIGQLLSLLFLKSCLMYPLPIYFLS